MSREIPIFFSTDDNYIPFLDVALSSLIENASRDYRYRIMILNTGLSAENKARILEREQEGFAIEFADIEKSYEEIQGNSKVLIITKSIISSSCVIKSQIMRLVSTNDFKKIYIASPVMYKDAEENLRKEFPERVYNLFEFIYFALDEDMDKNGWVVPGIGGSVYERLGIDSRSYFPRILDDRIP